MLVKGQKIVYNNEVTYGKQQGRNAYIRICRRAGSVRRGAVNHVRRGTEQH